MELVKSMISIVTKAGTATTTTAPIKDVEKDNFNKDVVEISPLTKNIRIRRKVCRHRFGSGLSFSNCGNSSPGFKVIVSNVREFASSDIEDLTQGRGELVLIERRKDKATGIRIQTMILKFKTRTGAIEAYKRFNGKLFGGFRMSAAFVINRDVQEEEEEFHRPVFKSVNRIKHNYKWAGGKKRTLLKW